MEIVNRVSRMAAIADKNLVTDVKTGLVPTSGAIHAGDLSLIRAARQMADLAVVSIFVNRLEYSSREEYERYPRDITADVDLLRPENVDYVFIPQEEEMYPASFSTHVEVRKAGEAAGLPAALFSGGATGVLKLLHLTKPSYVFYGEHEALQAAILRRMVRDLSISTEIIVTPCGREPSGLAYSGRNRLLNDSQRDAALAFHQSLRAAEDAVSGGETHSRKILSEMNRIVGEQPLARLEYAVILDPELLEPVQKIQGTVVAGVGGRVGDIFLTDAVSIESGRQPPAAG